MDTGELTRDKYGVSQSPKILSLVLLVVFVVGLSAGVVLTNGSLILDSDSNAFKASVDNDSGTNQFIFTEIDEGDNDEEVVTEHILHDFMFQATNRGGLVTWDFGDGTTSTGPEAIHQFEKPGLYIVKAIEGMAEACRELDFPVVSGNVSLYNETDGKAIPPTPVVGGVGLIEDVSKIATLKGAQDGDLAFLIGDAGSELGASLYARTILSLKGEDLGAPPSVDLSTTVKTAGTVRDLVTSGMVAAVHDASDGGMACAVTEMALAAGMGVEIYAPAERTSAFLFGENHDRYVVAVSADQEEAFRKAIGEAGLSLTQVGKFGGDAIGFKVVGAAEQSLSVAALREAHEGWLPSYMNSVD